MDGWSGRPPANGGVTILTPKAPEQVLFGRRPRRQRAASQTRGNATAMTTRFAASTNLRLSQFTCQGVQLPFARAFGADACLRERRR